MKIISTLFMILILYGLYEEYKKLREYDASILPIIFGLFGSFVVLLEIWT